LEQFFVIPTGCRRTGSRRTRHITTPTQVLGLGDDAIALWVDAPPRPGVRVIIALDMLAAIDDVEFLLDGRLSFLSADDRLTVRYNTVGRSSVEPAIGAVRAAVAGDPSPLPGQPVTAELPVKWRNIARSPRVLLRPDEPALLLFARPPSAPRDTLVAITAHELVVAREPFFIQTDTGLRRRQPEHAALAPAERHRRRRNAARARRGAQPRCRHRAAVAQSCARMLAVQRKDHSQGPG
jgi:hypothetical protein